MCRVEVRTLSVTTAGHLIAVGHEPLGIAENRDGRYAIRFAAEATTDLQRFQAAKARAEQLFATERQ